jgi:catechol 2,3-dioxygenase-like lactoylglutathione lyase family enzyme
MKLHRVSPILWTRDLVQTIQFYEELGFKAQSNFPNFTTLSRDNVELMFVVPEGEPDCDDPSKSVPLPTPQLTGSIYFFASDVDELWQKVKSKVIVKTPLENREYLMRDFSILDNNGYEIVFGKDISENHSK